MDNSWILSPCQRSRLLLLKRMIGSLAHPSERVVVVATQPDPLVRQDLEGFADHVVLCDFAEPVISRWWNRGLDYIAAIALAEHEVLVISSDYVGGPGSVALLAITLRQHGLTMVGPNLYNDKLRCFTAADGCGLYDRVPGACWMLAGESGLRVDEQFRWWYSDNDIDWQARHRSGVALVPGTLLSPEPDSELDEERTRWAIEDLPRFIAKWGHPPYW